MEELLEELKSISYVGIINIRKDRETLNRAVKAIEAWKKFEKDLIEVEDHLDEVRGYSGFYGGILYARLKMKERLEECKNEETA